MGEHPNVALIRQLFDAFDNADEEKIRSLMSEDVKWHMIGGETAEGLEALAAYMANSADDFSIETDVHDIVGNDDHVVALVTATATAGDQTFTYRTAEIAHVEEGRVTERWAFAEDTQAISDWFGQFE